MTRVRTRAIAVQAGRTESTWFGIRGDASAMVQWCDVEFPKALCETPVQDDLRYARNRVALMRFIDDGRLPAHNKIR